MMRASKLDLPALNTQAVQWSTTLGVLDNAAELVGCTPLQQATAVADCMRAQGLTTSFTCQEAVVQSCVYGQFLTAS